MASVFNACAPNHAIDTQHIVPLSILESAAPGQEDS